MTLLYSCGAEFLEALDDAVDAEAFVRLVVFHDDLARFIPFDFPVYGDDLRAVIGFKREAVEVDVREVEDICALRFDADAEIVVGADGDGRA